MISRITRSIGETEEAGEQLGRSLRAGDVVLLEGPLGAGKTAMVRGIVRGLGSGDHVASPTFVLAHEYQAAFPIVHIDLYRISEEADLADLGFEEYLGGDCLVMVEWPERAPGMIWGQQTWRIDISVTGPDERLLTIEPPAEREWAL